VGCNLRYVYLGFLYFKCYVFATKIRDMHSMTKYPVTIPPVAVASIPESTDYTTTTLSKIRSQSVDVYPWLRPIRYWIPNVRLGSKITLHSSDKSAPIRMWIRIFVRFSSKSVPIKYFQRHRRKARITMICLHCSDDDYNLLC
jgi:hypothetical protein